MPNNTLAQLQKHTKKIICETEQSLHSLIYVIEKYTEKMLLTLSSGPSRTKIFIIFFSWKIDVKIQFTLECPSASTTKKKTRLIFHIDVM